MIGIQFSGAQTLECHELVTFEGKKWVTEVLDSSQSVFVLNSERAVQAQGMNKLRII